MQAAEFWNRVAKRYAASPIADVDAYELTLERVRAHLRTTDRALELGCGTGTTALSLVDAVEHYTASDCSQAMLDIGRRKAAESVLGKLDFVVSSAETSTLGEGRFDVLSFNLLHLIEDLPGTLAHIRALLKPGGRFISKTPCWPERAVPLKYRALTALLPVLRLVNRAPDYVNLRSTRELEALFRTAGFEIDETGDYPNHPPSHFVVARRRGDA